MGEKEKTDMLLAQSWAEKKIICNSKSVQLYVQTQKIY